MPWPKRVIVLDDSCGLGGKPTLGNPHDDGFPQATEYPSTINGWLTFSFMDAKQNLNYFEYLELLGTMVYIGVWQDTIIFNSNNGDRDEEYFRLMSLKRPYTLDHYNYRARVTYNLAWAYHDYGPYDPPVPELLEYMKSHALFQKLLAEGIARKSPFYSQESSNAQKKAKPKEHKFSKKFKFIPV